MNSAYEVTASWQVGAPELANNHDLQRLPNGRALMLIYKTDTPDLSAYGGLTNTTFIDTWIQEVDLHGNVYFDWQKVPPYSRGVEYEIDEVNKVITRTWEYSNTPPIYNCFMGNLQRLPNGNRFLGWSGPSSIGMGVGADGTKRLEMTVESAAGFVYRWFRRESQPLSRRPVFSRFGI